MKIRIEVDLCLERVFFCDFVRVGEGLSKSSEMVVEMWKRLLTKIPNKYRVCPPSS